MGQTIEAICPSGNIERTFLKPGEVYLSRDGEEVTTILGSCVAVCIYDKKLRFGVINHIVLPSTDVSSLTSRLDSMNFADHSTIALLKYMKKNGSGRGDLVIKILGGASRISFNSESEIGKMNLKAAECILSKYNFRINAKICGGSTGLKVVFNTETGEIKYQKLKQMKCA